MTRFVVAMALLVAFAAPAGAAETEGPYTSPCGGGSTVWYVVVELEDQDAATVSYTWDEAPLTFSQEVIRGQHFSSFHHPTSATLVEVSVDGPIQSIDSVQAFCP